MGLVLKDDSKGRKTLQGLQKPSRRRKIDAEVNNGHEVVERIERRLARLEKLYRQTNNLLLEYCEIVEKLKRRER